MSTPPLPAPSVPTPQLAPAAAGLLQGLMTSALTVKLCVWLGLTIEAGIVIAGAVVSLLTSVCHRIAQHIHWMT